MNRLGPISLACAAIGLVGTEAAIHWGWLAAPAWRILATGFEAATVGACADWFAVRALFHRVPIPIISRHTDIIARNRDRIQGNIVDLVANQWLTPPEISVRLRQWSPSQTVRETLKQPGNRSSVIGIACDQIADLMRGIDASQLAVVCMPLLSGKLRELDLPDMLASSLASARASGGHRSMVDHVMEVIGHSLGGPEGRDQVRTVIDHLLTVQAPRMVELMRDGESRPRLVAWLREHLSGLDLPSLLAPALRRAIAGGRHEKLIARLLGAVSHIIASDRVRQHLDAAIGDKIDALGKQAADKSFLDLSWMSDRAKQGIISVARNSLVRDIQSEAAQALVAASSQTDHPLRVTVDEALNGVVAQLEQRDPELIADLDRLRTGLAESLDLDQAVDDLLAGIARALAGSAGKPPLLDSDALAAFVCSEATAHLNQVRNDPSHPLHAFLERQIVGLETDLRTPGSRSGELVLAMRDRIAASPELPHLLTGIFQPLAQRLAASLRNPISPLRAQVAQCAERGLAVLESDPGRQARLDTWVHGQMDGLVSSKHHLIGTMIGEKLARLPDLELVSQIESKVGDDLQWIRLNGAVVGGFIGIFIGTVRYILQ
jgi:uncharacterized membrane-anchored protein YjiN (DUF445 family)